MSKCTNYWSLMMYKVWYDVSEPGESHPMWYSVSTCEGFSSWYSLTNIKEGLMNEPYARSPLPPEEVPDILLIAEDVTFEECREVILLHALLEGHT